jgi:hypothetical protein
MANDLSGWSVSMSSDGTRVAIGALNNDGNGSDSGHARIYEESEGIWTQISSDIDGEAAGDQSSLSVSISPDGTRVAIGATENDGNGLRAGHVSVYGELILPVELIRFEAITRNNQSQLSWQTAPEDNNLGFDILRSNDGIFWKSLGFVNGKGTSDIQNEYTYLDKHPNPGDNYYRLKQIDFDGQYEYSAIVQVFFESKEKADLQIYPNPSSGQFTLSFQNPKLERATLKLFDSTGQLIWQENFSDSEKVQHWEKQFELLPEKLYFVVAQLGAEIICKKIMIVQHE